LKNLRLLILLFLLLGTVHATPAAASSGGDELPFNPAIKTITDNLTGPTASAFIIAMAIGGLFMIGMSRDSPIMKTVGQVIVIGACIAKLPKLLPTLGLTGASAEPIEISDYLFLAVAVTGWTAGVLFYLSPYLSLLGERHSLSE